MMRLWYILSNARHFERLKLQWRFEEAIGAEEMRRQRAALNSPENDFHGRFDR